MKLIPAHVPSNACAHTITIDNLTVTCALPTGHDGLHSIETSRGREAQSFTGYAEIDSGRRNNHIKNHDY